MFDDFLSLSVDPDRLGHMLLWAVQIFALIMVGIDIKVMG
jgi:hypothetical protein